MLVNLKQAVNEYRFKTGLNQSQVSIKLGMHKARLSKIITQKVCANKQDRQKLSEILNRPKEWLFATPSLPPRLSDTQPTATSK